MGHPPKPAGHLLILSIVFGLGASHTATAFGPADLGVIINEADTLSISIGEYYVRRRSIPPANVIRIVINTKADQIEPVEFEAIYNEVQQKTPRDVQAYALTWLTPYRVGCMSITTAFAAGYAKRFCASGCRATAPSPYFDSTTRRPYDEYRLRPSMLVGARTYENAKALIDRGLASDYTRPASRAYLNITEDQARNTRAPLYAAIKLAFMGHYPVTIQRSEGIRDRHDVIFYFTGAKHVPYLDSLGFLPGAIGDHLTSGGGRLTGGKQMSALRWLEAGATGSYGTVVEPCNYPYKFPHPGVVMKYYLKGESLIEAYWKSVRWPGQGVFIGEPLAKPFAVPPAESP